MSEAISILFPVLLYTSQGCCLQYFYGSFLTGRIRDKRWNGLAAAASYTVLKLAMSRVGEPESWEYRAAAWRLAAALCFLTVIAFCFYKAFCLITAFLVVTFQAVSDISRYMAVIWIGELGDGMLDFWNWCAGKGIFVSKRSFAAAVNAGLIGGWILQYLMMSLALYLLLRKIVRDFREKEYGIRRTELLFLLTPSAVGLMLCLLLRIIIVAMEDGAPQILYDRYPILVAVIPAILLLSLLSILYGVKLFQDMIYLNRERSSRIILEKQVAGLQEHMEEMERVYSGIRSMKHDMKNTVLVMERLLAEDGVKEHAELKDYLAELNRTFEKLEVRFRTGNGIVDTLLNMKYYEALREVPDLKLEADGLLFPPGLKIQSYDVGIILGNALDNAIEACKRLKAEEPGADAFIRLGSLRKGNLLILKIENSFDGRLVKKGQDEFPETVKEDRESHGIGLSNIKSTARKYQGTMDFKVNGRVFILSVMMKNERRDEDGVWNPAGFE